MNLKIEFSIEEAKKDLKLLNIDINKDDYDK